MADKAVILEDTGQLKAVPVTAAGLALIDDATPAAQLARLGAAAYSEGTCPLGVSFGGGVVGIIYALDPATYPGFYSKIGTLVTVTGYLELSNKGSSTGTARITGLPFTITNALGAYAGLSISLSGITFSGQILGEGEINTSNILLEQVTEAGVKTLLSNANFTNTSSFTISFTYRAA